MEFLYFTRHVDVPANGTGKLYIAPADATTKWKAKNLSYLPQVTSAIHATDYADITPKVGATAIGAVRSTNSATGSALTAGTSENVTLTGKGSELEISQASPFLLDVDATPGAGVAVNMAITLVVEVVRT